jgi:large subunit ribosomal protein L30
MNGTELKDSKERKEAKPRTNANASLENKKPAQVAKPNLASESTVNQHKNKEIKHSEHKHPDHKNLEHKHIEPGHVDSQGKLALILVRGFIRMRKSIMDTLFALRLRKKHVCVVVDDNPVNRAAAAKCKDYIAYGEITEETYKLLVEKRGKKDSDGKLKKFFSLSPPRGGFERKGIKTPFTSGGALGYRGIKMNELIRRMI